MRNIEPSTVADITFYRVEVTAKNQMSRKQALPCEPSVEEQQQFITSLVGVDSKPVGLRLFKETCTKFKPELPPTVRLPTPLRDHYREGEPRQGTMREEIHKMKMAMTVSHEEINK